MRINQTLTTISMKKRYTFTDGETIIADLDDLHRLLAENQCYVDNYEDVYSSLEDDDYVARGNGFCDRKYSDDFIEGQMEKYGRRVKEIEGWIVEWPGKKRSNNKTKIIQSKKWNKCPCIETSFLLNTKLKSMK